MATTNENNEFIGARIRRLREAKNLTGAAIQRLTGLSQATLYRVEVAGVVTPRSARLLAKVLGVPAEDLHAEPAAQRPVEQP